MHLLFILLPLQSQDLQMILLQTNSIVLLSSISMLIYTSRQPVPFHHAAMAKAELAAAVYDLSLGLLGNFSKACQQAACNMQGTCAICRSCGGLLGVTDQDIVNTSK